jgi:starch synthase
MYAMRYGCLPIARATGGLADTISDPLSSSAPTGFLFPNADASSFTTALKRALRLYKKHALWQAMQFNAMSCDFSWSVSARNYLNLYTQLSENSSIVSEP